MRGLRAMHTIKRRRQVVVAELVRAVAVDEEVVGVEDAEADDTNSTFLGRVLLRCLSFLGLVGRYVLYLSC